MAKDYCVYIAKCRDGSLYTGITNDLEQRVLQHNTGRGAKYTQARRPIKIVYVEKNLEKGKALSREIGIKKMSRSNKLALIKNKK